MDSITASCERLEYANACVELEACSCIPKVVDVKMRILRKPKDKAVCEDNIIVHGPSSTVDSFVDKCSSDILASSGDGAEQVDDTIDPL
ncbi:hypothetical protein V6N13_036761 [Hibiscus sabdariffa]